LYRTGTAKGSELGGLYKSMPWTATFSIVGAASISAFPLFSGFVAKSLILQAAADTHHTVTWLVLLLGSAGVFHHSKKVPFFAFFAHDSGKRVAEAPWHMLIAMGLASALCIFLGVASGPLYSILPNGGSGFTPYTIDHVQSQLQLLLGAAAGFTLLKQLGVYPAELPSVNLDSDWFYRKPIPRMVRALWIGVDGIRDSLGLAVRTSIRSAAQWLAEQHTVRGRLGLVWSTGQIAIWSAVLLGGYLLMYFWVRS
jgi:multicomponent Na+:H+ antiporter subunit D